MDGGTVANREGLRSGVTWSASQVGGIKNYLNTSKDYKKLMLLKVIKDIQNSAKFETVITFMPSTTTRLCASGKH